MLAARCWLCSVQGASFFKSLCRVRVQGLVFCVVCRFGTSRHESLVFPTSPHPSDDGAEAEWREQDLCETFVLGLLTWWAPGCGGRITSSIHPCSMHAYDENRDVSDPGSQSREAAVACKGHWPRRTGRGEASLDSRLTVSNPSRADSVLVGPYHTYLCFMLRWTAAVVLLRCSSCPGAVSGIEFRVKTSVTSITDLLNPQTWS